MFCSPGAKRRATKDCITYTYIYILNTTKLWLLYLLLVHLKFPPQRLSHYVFTYCQAVRHPVLLRGSLFLFSVKMRRSDRTNRQTDRRKKQLDWLISQQKLNTMLTEVYSVRYTDIRKIYRNI